MSSLVGKSIGTTLLLAAGLIAGTFALGASAPKGVFALTSTTNLGFIPSESSTSSTSTNSTSTSATSTSRTDTPPNEDESDPAAESMNTPKDTADANGSPQTDSVRYAATGDDSSEKASNAEKAAYGIQLDYSRSTNIRGLELEYPAWGQAVAPRPADAANFVGRGIGYGGEVVIIQ